MSMSRTMTISSWSSGKMASFITSKHTMRSKSTSTLGCQIKEQSAMTGLTCETFLIATSQPHERVCITLRGAAQAISVWVLANALEQDCGLHRLAFPSRSLRSSGVELRRERVDLAGQPSPFGSGRAGDSSGHAQLAWSIEKVLGSHSSAQPRTVAPCVGSSSLTSPTVVSDKSDASLARSSMSNDEGVSDVEEEGGEEACSTPRGTTRGVSEDGCGRSSSSIFDVELKN